MSTPRKIKLVKKPAAPAPIDIITGGSGVMRTGDISHSPKNGAQISPDRCIAICADNTQCTRVKKRGCLLCGTHAKNGGGSVSSRGTAIDVWVEEINGIAYYLDKNGNVYDTESVLENRPNPFIIGHYTGTKPNITIEFV